jgi:hypothetical protein
MQPGPKFKLAMAKIGHPDEDRTNGEGIPLHLRAELSTRNWIRRSFTTRAPDIKELALALEVFQEQELDAAHLDLFAWAKMAGLRIRRWPTVPRQYRVL